MCGENAKTVDKITSPQRFTPTCVGKTSLADCRGFRVGWFTPTCVGKTSSKMSKSGRITGSPPRVWGKRYLSINPHNMHAVHPHVCGENICSPRLPPQITWFTPTCVGKTQHAAPAARGVHGSPPRVWGKRHGRALRSILTTGSPPRVWGKRILIWPRVR